jgi:hypothetical protein
MAIILSVVLALATAMTTILWWSSYEREQMLFRAIGRHKMLMEGRSRRAPDFELWRDAGYLVKCLVCKQYNANFIRCVHCGERQPFEVY